MGVRHRRVRSLGYRDDKLDLSCVVGVEVLGRIRANLVCILMIRTDEHFEHEGILTFVL